MEEAGYAAPEMASRAIKLVELLSKEYGFQTYSKDEMRKRFEETTIPSFPLNERSYHHTITGEYMDPNIEDHWQTFQEGWEQCIEYLKKKGMDPR